MYVFYFSAVQAASKTLMDSLNEIYESQWTGHDLLYVQAQNLDMLWQDFTHKLADQVLVPLNTYQSQFPEMRVRSIQFAIIAANDFFTILSIIAKLSTKNRYKLDILMKIKLIYFKLIFFLFHHFFTFMKLFS